MALWTILALCALCAGTATADVKDWDQYCIDEPVGFGKGTVGGKGGVTVTPKTNAELLNYLKDNTPRIIQLDHTFDFTGTEGKTTGDGCYFKKCGTGFQYSLAKSDTCNGKEAAKVTYDTAGVTPLNVGSYKTIIGLNGKGVIRGKGLMIKNAKQVIVRDISIIDINPAVIWGGDALSLYGVDKVWIHNVVFRNIGRQFLVTYQAVNTGVTVSSCTFDGSTSNSAYCDGKHYWVWLFWGNDDRITIINNKIINTSGRLPHAGGYTGSKNFIHVVGNHFDTNSDVALEPWEGAIMLVENNRYFGMRAVVNTNASKGYLFLVSTAKEAATCSATFGENCDVNAFASSGSVRRTDANVLNQARSVGVDAINEARDAACMPKFVASELLS